VGVLTGIGFRGGDIEGESTWSDTATYHLEGAVTVAAGGMLTLPPGTVVKNGGTAVLSHCEFRYGGKSSGEFIRVFGASSLTLVESTLAHGDGDGVILSDGNATIMRLRALLTSKLTMSGYDLRIDERSEVSRTM
jgi:hypothetical protein